eukprot:TRINITY_DN1339_c0_g2_i1.p1 TRINITY_DN1339_c0_g2~~TRINITY_DN1339_c0_g2_i1.p1  ORF type:complete len:555 (+),score=134.75 TRINITY_DN1339_c0_g2_i1:716-2380(+)
MRVVVEVKRGAVAQQVLNALFKHTQLQTQFNCNMVGLVNSEPRELHLKDFFQVFLDFRCGVVKRRALYTLKRAEDRNHLLEGLLIALARMDDVVLAIRSTKDGPSAVAKLKEEFGLSDVQADGVLSTPLRRLTSLERGKLEGENNQLLLQITDLRGLIESRQRILEVVAREAEEVKQQFGTPRRTRLEQHLDGELSDEDVLPNDMTLVVLSEKGYMKRMAEDGFTQQRRNTKGRSGGKLKGDDQLARCFACKLHDTVMLFSTKGIVYTMKAHRIPASSRQAMGTPISQLLPMESDEKVTSVLPVSEFASGLSVVMLTAKGWIKRVSLAEFSIPRKNGLVAIQLADGDELKWVRLTSENDNVVVVSAFGMLIRCRIEELRKSKRATRGVVLMTLSKGDTVAAMDVLPDVVREDKDEGPWLLLVTESGLGKRVPTESFTYQTRKGRGIASLKLVEGDKVGSLHVVGAAKEEGGGETDVVIASHGGILNRFRVNDIPVQSRAARGVFVMKLQEGDFVKAVSLVPSATSESEDEPPLSLPEQPSDSMSESEDDGLEAA